MTSLLNSRLRRRVRQLGATVAVTLLACVAGSASAIESNEYLVVYHHDAIGSPVAATDEKGRLLWREGREAYGRSLGRSASDGQLLRDNAAESAPTRLGYTGHTEDTRVGLTYMGARFYDPVLGRFVSTDPAPVAPLQPATFNRYAYANNNPFTFVDPDGEFAVVAVPWAGKALTSLAVAVGVYGTATVITNDVVQPQINGMLSENSESPGSPRRTPNPLPALDLTGKVHGELPTPDILDQYPTSDLEQLLDELKKSIEERSRKNTEMGADKPHSDRLNQEVDLIRSLDKHLDGRKDREKEQKEKKEEKVESNSDQ